MTPGAQTARRKLRGLAELAPEGIEKWGDGARTHRIYSICSALARPVSGPFIDRPESGALFPTCGFRIPRRFAFTTPFGRYPRDVATTC